MLSLIHEIEISHTILCREAHDAQTGSHVAERSHRLVPGLPRVTGPGDGHVTEASLGWGHPGLQVSPRHFSLSSVSLWGGTHALQRLLTHVWLWDPP